MQEAPVELDGLQALVALADEGSVLGAARKLGISRMSVRRRVLALSEEFGVLLAQATPAGLVLTEAGQQCAVDATKLLRDYVDIKETVRAGAEEVSGSVTIASPPGGAGCWTVPLAASLIRQFPNLSLEIVSGLDPIDALAAGADIALWTELPAKGKGLMVRSLGRVDVGLFAAPAYASTTPLPRGVEELRGHTLVGGGVSGFGRSLPLCAGGTIEVQPRICTEDAGAAIAAIGMGVGIGLLVVHDADGLVPVLKSQVGTSLPIYALFRAQRARLPRVQIILETISTFLTVVGQEIPDPPRHPSPPARGPGRLHGVRQA